MECWDKMMTPMRKVWTKVSKRIGLRKTGIVKLKQDVRTCEYEDVHILWDMLKRKETHMCQHKKRAVFGVCSMGKAHSFVLPGRHLIASLGLIKK